MTPRIFAWPRKPSASPLKCRCAGLGFSMVELLSTCPTNWGYTPQDSLKWLEEHMVPYYPLNDFKVNPALTSIKF